MDHSEHRPRLSDLAEEQLLCRIRSGELSVGTRLPSEPDLAQQMGISRGILREALNALQTRGYITRTPRGGSHITRPDESALGANLSQSLMNASLAELLDIREAMELYAARTIVTSVTDEDIARLRELEIFDEQFSVPGCRDFHYYLAELTGMRLFSQFIEFFFERAESMVDPMLFETRPKALMSDHGRILAAIEKRNSAAVVTAMRRHFRNVRKHYLGKG